MPIEQNLPSKTLEEIMAEISLDPELEPSAQVLPPVGETLDEEEWTPLDLP